MSANPGAPKQYNRYSNYSSSSSNLYPPRDKKGYPKPPYKNKHSNYPPKNNYVPAQQNNGMKKYKPKGFHHMANFGKYRCEEDNSWYNVANKHDFPYMKWCLNTDTIELDTTTKPHLYTALQIEEDEKAVWTSHRDACPTETGLFKLYYTAEINGETHKGPEINQRFCLNCNKYLVQDFFKMDPNMCALCCRSLQMENGMDV